jgi:XTP/dITP diphosphohydrolase
VKERTVVVATRSDHKLREIVQILPNIPGLRLIDLPAAGILWSPEEDTIEAFETFEENALAKARFFAARSGLTVLADDSGLCVDALDGAPGVYSKRFSGRTDLTGEELDGANNRRLLDALAGVPDEGRGAHYVCVIALVTPDGSEYVHRGTVAGRILAASRGSGGFGYDPLFYVPSLDATLAEASPEVKNAISHRARALKSALPDILALQVIHSISG